MANFKETDFPGKTSRKKPAVGAAKERKKFPTKEEYFVLIREWKNATGEKKRKLGGDLIDNVDPLVHRFARSFWHKYSRFLNLEDFIQAGRIGVLNALRTWDEKIARKHDVHFTTHSAWWMKSEMHRLVTKEGCRSVRLPHNAYNKNRKDLAEGKPLSYPESIKCYSLESINLAGSQEDEHHTRDKYLYHIGAFLEPVAEEETYASQLGERLTAAVKKIPKQRDREILLRRLEGETLENIAKSYKFSRERIRQICSASIKFIGREVKGREVQATA